MSTSDHLDPTAVVLAKARAADRQAAEIEATRTQRQQQRTYRSKAREVHARWTGKREQQREARNRAEEWLQALREWETANRAELVPRTALGSGGAGRMVAIVGNYGKGRAMLPITEIRTPLGWVSESRVVALCNQDELLGRIRSGAGLSSLIHGSGQGWAGSEARAYATALLGMATELGDERAARLLPLVET